MLGHRDASVTYNVYIHLFGNDLEEMRLYNKSWGKEQKNGQSKPNQVK